MNSDQKIMNATIVMPFGRISGPKLLTKSLDISASVVGNAFFPTPTPTLEVIDGFILLFQSALVAAASRDRTQVILKNRARVDLVANLKALGNYVTFTSDGNSAMIGSTAFDTRKLPQPVIVVKPTATVETGVNSGELITNVTRPGKARGFVHQYTKDPLTEISPWESFPTTSKKFTFTRLEKAKVYWCRVGIMGAKGQLIFSDPVSKVVQ